MYTSYLSQAPQAVLVEKNLSCEEIFPYDRLSCGEVSPHEKCEDNLSHSESSPHDVWRKLNQILCLWRKEDKYQVIKIVLRQESISYVQVRPIL